MVRQVRASCAGVFALVLVGCTPSLAFLNVGAAGQAGQGQLVIGSLDGVTVAAQATLTRMGLAVQANRDGQTVRLRSATRSGKRFALVLESQASGAGQGTHVHIEWEDGADEGFWVEFLTALPRAQRDTAPAAAPR